MRYAFLDNRSFGLVASFDYANVTKKIIQRTFLLKKLTTTLPKCLPTITVFAHIIGVAIVAGTIIQRILAKPYAFFYPCEIYLVDKVIHTYPVVFWQPNV